MKTGIEMIAEERQRQIDVEGYSEQHDSQHKASTLIYAAIAYVESAKVGVNCAEMGNTNEHEIMMRKAEIGIHYPLGWAFKPSTDVRDLVKAGALIAAAIDRILPSLKESEDEKVRKGIIELVKQSSEILNKKNQERMLTWLEKQASYTTIVETGDGGMSEENKGNLGGISPTWSEEDEKTLNEIFSVAARASLRKSTLFGKSYDYIKWQNWLKSLRPQSHWKPSDNELEVLRLVAEKDGTCLMELYEQLKKLKEGKV